MLKFPGENNKGTCMIYDTCCAAGGYEFQIEHGWNEKRKNALPTVCGVNL